MGKFFILMIALLLTSNILHCLPINEGEEANGQVDEATSEKPSLNHSPFGSYQDEDDDESGEEDLCPICRDDFLEDPALDLVCGHKYHMNCLREYHRSTNHLGKCFLCMKELVVRGNKELDLNEFFYREELSEVVRNKLKIGLQAARTNMPFEWKRLPDKWGSDGRSYY